METLKNLCNKFIEVMQDEAGFVIAVVAFVIALFVLAVFAEKNYYKTAPAASKVNNVKKLSLIGVFSALAAILMYFELPLFFAPSFYKIDFSEVPVLICGFILGPVSAASAEAVKILIKLIIHPTSTAFVGEFANFVVGCAFVIPASILYQRKKTRKNAIVSMGVGTVVSTLTGMFTNAFILLPAFAALYGGMPVSALIDMGTAVNPAITNLFTFIILAVTPLNLIKFTLVSLVVFVIYKKISSLLKIKLN